MIASPDTYAARRVLELARTRKPAHRHRRAHSHAICEREHFEKEGVGRVVMGERELANGMTDYALESLAR